jgi:hypothetical protein
LQLDCHCRKIKVSFVCYLRLMCCRPVQLSGKRSKGIIVILISWFWLLFGRILVLSRLLLLHLRLFFYFF